MSVEEERSSFAVKREVGIARLGIGLVQGIALYFLSIAYDEKSWPADNGLIFAPLLLVALFVPLILAQGLGNIRLRTLALWSGGAALMLAALGFYDIWRNGTDAAPAPDILPSFGLFAFSFIGLFIAHALIVGGDAERKFMASYPTHFDVAWKLAVQVALSAVFVGVFWLVLWLGANLFELINLGFLRRLIEERWFAIPATTLATAAALHVTDVRAGLVRGVRTLLLVLMSWLLPVMTLIAAGFIAGLFVTGLEPLWQTQHAAALLLIAAAVLIILINATYQDGDPGRAPPHLLRLSGTVAAIVLVPIVGLAAYALGLRVAQYGWTINRIATAACALVAASYALGYAAAAFIPGAWLKRIELWNFCTALFILVVLVAVFSPAADPARISVASQVARLEAGAAKPEEFDFKYLRWEGGRFGRDALAELEKTAQGPNAAYVREKAKTVLAAKSQYESAQPLPQDLAKLITAHTPDGKLPESFVKQDWRRSKANIWIPACLARGTDKCDAWVMDLDGDKKDDVLLIEGAQATGFALAADGWQPFGTWNLYGCQKFRDAAHAGAFKTVPPAPPPWPDIEIMGERFRFVPPNSTPECPK